MENIEKIHEDVFRFLEGFRKSIPSFQKPLFYTLRRSNRAKRLDKGYWFYGNEDYLAVSFWSGMDWKNKTPNIYFSILPDGRTSLHFRCRDSIKKANFVEKVFQFSLGLRALPSDSWVKDYTGTDYMKSLELFLESDKKKIDELLLLNLKIFDFDDESNKIGFIDKDIFEKVYDNVIKYRNKIIQDTLPYALLKFKINNFGPISETQIPDLKIGQQFIFLVGENGCGKSTILKAIASTLRSSYHEDNYSKKREQWKSSVYVKIKDDYKQYDIGEYDNEDIQLNKIPFVAYGPSRLVSNNERNKKQSKKKQTSKNPLYNIFYPDGVLEDINVWLVEKSAKSNSKSEQDNFRIVYENIKQMLIDIIPKIYDIREEALFEKNRFDILYFENDSEDNKIEQGVPFDVLSTGIRSLIAMLGDMMIKLFEQQQEILDPAALGGIVLIDEIDIHMHPIWQKKIPILLNEYFPKIQFILTTHSPIPLLGAPKNSSIFLITRDIEKGIFLKNLDYLHVENLLPNTIFTSPIFGMDTLVSESNEDISKVNIDDSFQDTEFFEILDKKFDELEKRENILNRKYFTDNESN